MRRVQLFMEGYENLCMDTKDSALWNEEVRGEVGLAEKIYEEYTNLNNPAVLKSFAEIYLAEQNIVLHEDDATTVSDLMDWKIREKVWREYAAENI